MKSSGRNLSLTSYDDLFATDESRADADREKVMEIPLSELFPFKDHPFKVKNDEKMQETADSIREYGVLVPAIARPREGGGYELISGHRRKMGSKAARLAVNTASRRFIYCRISKSAIWQAEYQDFRIIAPFSAF